MLSGRAADKDGDTGSQGLDEGIRNPEFVGAAITIPSEARSFGLFPFRYHAGVGGIAIEGDPDVGTVAAGGAVACGSSSILLPVLVAVGWISPRAQGRVAEGARSRGSRAAIIGFDQDQQVTPSVVEISHIDNLPAVDGKDPFVVIDESGSRDHV